MGALAQAGHHSTLQGPDSPTPAQPHALSADLPKQIPMEQQKGPFVFREEKLSTGRDSMKLTWQWSPLRTPN